MDLTYIESFRKKQKITTREFAKMCKMTPSRYCDLKFNREKPTVQEGSNIIKAVTNIKIQLSVGKEHKIFKGEIKMKDYEVKKCKSCGKEFKPKRIN